MPRALADNAPFRWGYPEICPNEATCQPREVENVDRLGVPGMLSACFLATILKCQTGDGDRGSGSGSVYHAEHDDGDIWRKQQPSELRYRESCTEQSEQAHHSSRRIRQLKICRRRSQLRWMEAGKEWEGRRGAAGAWSRLREAYESSAHWEGSGNGNCLASLAVVTLANWHWTKQKELGAVAGAIPSFPPNLLLSLLTSPTYHWNCNETTSSSIYLLFSGTWRNVYGRLLCQNLNTVHTVGERVLVGCFNWFGGAS